MTTAHPTAADPGVADAALTALRQLVGSPDAEFRDGQLEAIDALVSARSRALVVQRTGWGKSAVYFVATRLLRDAGAGPTLIVSPLLALMRDQVAAAERAGVRAVTMNSANAQDWDDVRAALAADEVDVLLVSPERLNNPRFRDEQLPALAQTCGMLVVDEAHCVSDWGHDFRPDYRRIRDLLTALPAGTPVLGTTATANARVVLDVQEQLGAGGVAVATIRGGLARDSLRLGVAPTMSAEQRIAWLVAHLADLPGSGIVYSLTVAGADDIAEALRAAGFEVAAYTGRTDADERERLEGALRDNEVKALVATSALGMGFDKPDLGFVVHVGAPSSPVSYYQQVGRAGRGASSADVLLLPGPEDRDIWTYFASVSMPRQEQAVAVLAALRDAAGPLSTAAIEARVDVRRTRLELLLKVLDVDGAVTRVSGGWAATGLDWDYDAARYERVTQARQAEAGAMLEYAATHGCRMAFLQRCLDDPSAGDCGRCDVCAGVWFDDDVPAAALGLTRDHLSRAGTVIAPRAQWPSGLERLGVPERGKIGAEAAVEPGRAVGRLSDVRWGSRLRELLRTDQPITEADLREAVPVLAQWDWRERPAAVVAMPSRAHPTLVDSLAAGIARLGRLPHLGSLELAHGGPTSGPGGNSAFRVASLHGRIVVGDELRARLGDLRGPVLLVDDLVDSRWTFTVAGAALRQAGADAVLPFALAQAG